MKDNRLTILLVMICAISGMYALVLIIGNKDTQLQKANKAIHRKDSIIEVLTKLYDKQDSVINSTADWRY